MVCITGYGMIDACGSNPDQCWSNMTNDRDLHKPIDQLFQPSDSVKSIVGLYPDQIPEGNLPRTMKYGLYVVDQALQMAGLEPKENVATIFSSLTGGNEWNHQMITTDKYRPKKVIRGPVDALCSYIAQQYGFTGLNTCVYSACASGLVSISLAAQLVDEYDYVVVGGSDAGINPIDMGAFSALRALGTKSRPFDDRRDGFIMGEGAGCLILESEEKAKARGAKIYARISDYAHASDAYDETQPSGRGARICLSNLDTNVDAVSAHGTSTPLGDKVEYDVVREFTNAPIFSNKGKIGHTFAAAGVLETIYCVLAIQHNTIPHTHGYVTGEMLASSMNIKTEVNKILNNSFGFGGKCCSMIIER